MNIKAIKEEARITLKGKREPLFLLILITILFEAALLCIGIGILLIPIFTCGLFYVCKKLILAEELNNNLIITPFKDFNFIIKILGVFLLSGILVIVGLIVFIVPGFVILFRYSQALYLLCDKPDLKISEVLDESASIMKGHKIEMFLFDLSFIGHFVLFILSLGIYGIYFLPYYKVSATNYYLHLTNQKKEVQKHIPTIEPDEYF